MKTKVCLFLAFVTIANLININFAIGQSPAKFNYQVVIRSLDGTVLSNTNLELTINIIQGNPEGSIVFTETHSVLTNLNGLVSLVVGSENTVEFETIDWANGPYFIEIFVDGNLMGLSQLLSVPYALHAKTAEIADNGFSGSYNDLTEKPTGNNLGDIQYWDGSKWVLTEGGETGQSLTFCYGVPIWGPCTSEPRVKTADVQNITASAATVGGSINYQGASAVTARGIAWSTSENPTLESNEGITSDGVGMGEFSSEISGLEQLTTYFVKAYAVNSEGVAYGLQKQFKTSMTTSGLLLHYSFNDNTLDLSENAFHGSGNVSYSESANESLGSAASFNGVDQYVDMPINPTLKPSLPVSFSFWLYYDDLFIENTSIFDTDFAQNLSSGVGMNVSSTGYLAIGYGDALGSFSVDRRRTKMGTTQIQAGIWYHIVGVVNGPLDMSIYINGIDDGGAYSGNGEELGYSEAQGSIGRKDSHSSYPAYYLKGKLDEFTYWNRALTPQEVTALYNH